MNRRRAKPDTIAAVSTPPGKGALAVVRASGELAFAITRAVFRPDAGTLPIIPEKGVLVGRFFDPKRAREIDRLVLLIFPGPASPTGEDVVEFHCHGGDVTPQLILRTLIESGCRLAEPGEFTMRAFLNERIDLIQAESVLDIIEAKSELHQQDALSKMDGSLSRVVSGVKEKILELSAQLEYIIDFPEEDDAYHTQNVEAGRGSRLIEQIDLLLETALDGDMVRDGVKTVIAGAPNVGKSSLFNLLLEVERTIVTPYPGTTRDAVEAAMNMDGMPVLLVDTAGLRATDDPIEKKGIEFSQRYVAGADTILLVTEANRNLYDEEKQFLEDNRNRCVVVINKTDLGLASDARDLAGSCPVVLLSCLEREGVTVLKEKIAERTREAIGIPAEGTPPLILRTRHREGLLAAREALSRFREGAGVIPVELLSVELREAREALAGLTGEITTETILEKIFEDFCIGK